MDGMLYKLFFFNPSGPEPAEAREQRKALGIRRLLTAEMGWSNHRYAAFGVELYPDMSAAQGYQRYLNQSGFSLPGESYLGIPMDETYPDFYPRTPLPGETPVYRLYFSRPAPLSFTAETGEYEAMLERVIEARTRAGGYVLLSAYIRWNSEEWEYFGVETFSNTDGLLAYSQFLTESGWYRFTEARSYLGLATGGVLVGEEGE